jgi:hypothetical protein
MQVSLSEFLTTGALRAEARKAYGLKALRNVSIGALHVAIVQGVRAGLTGTPGTSAAGQPGTAGSTR